MRTLFYYLHKKRDCTSNIVDAVSCVENEYVLKGVSFEIEEGKILGIIGKNGSGNVGFLDEYAKSKKQRFIKVEMLNF